jgi:hypothetical protein
MSPRRSERSSFRSVPSRYREPEVLSSQKRKAQVPASLGARWTGAVATLPKLQRPLLKVPGTLFHESPRETAMLDELKSIGSPTA